MSLSLPLIFKHPNSTVMLAGSLHGLFTGRYFWSGYLASTILAFMLWTVKGMDVQSCPVAQCLDTLSRMPHLYLFTCQADRHLTEAPEGTVVLAHNSVVNLEAECEVGDLV